MRRGRCWMMILSSALGTPFDRRDGDHRLEHRRRSRVQRRAPRIPRSSRLPAFSHHGAPQPCPTIPRPEQNHRSRELR
jgi:hypothetical protein